MTGGAATKWGYDLYDANERQVKRGMVFFSSFPSSPLAVREKIVVSPRIKPSMKRKAKMDTRGYLPRGQVVCPTCGGTVSRPAEVGVWECTGCYTRVRCRLG